RRPSWSRPSERRFRPDRCNPGGEGVQCSEPRVSRRDAGNRCAEVPAMIPMSWSSSRRRLVFVTACIAVVVVGGGLAWAAANAAQERQKAESVYSLLHVARVQPSVLFTSPKSQEPDKDFEAYKRTQLILVKCRLLLNAALRDPRLADLPVVNRQDDP